MRKFNFKKIISALAILSATFAAFCCSSTTTFAHPRKTTIDIDAIIRLLSRNPSHRHILSDINNNQPQNNLPNHNTTTIYNNRNHGITRAMRVFGPRSHHNNQSQNQQNQTSNQNNNNVGNARRPN